MEKRRNILLVDDDELYCKAASLRLERAGFNTTLLKKDQMPDILNVIESNNIEMVLLDLIMPEIDGKALLKKIRSKYERNILPVIIVTGMDDSSDVAESFGLGANDYITKPISFDVAAIRIHAHLSQCDLDLERTKQKELEVLNAMIITYCHELSTPLCILAAEFSRLEVKYQGVIKEDLSRSKKAFDRMEEILRQIRQSGEKPEIHYETYTGNSKMVKIK